MDQAIFVFAGIMGVLIVSWVLIPGPLLQRTDRASGFESAPVRSDLIGTRGTAITDLRPSGTALFGDERTDVVSESEWITEGTPVEVIRAEGYRCIVRPIADLVGDVPD